jgi:hypothetical protein
MRKADAIAKAELLGYTIKYTETKDELRYRKPGAAMNALNEPDEAFIISRKGSKWSFEIVQPMGIL